MADHGGQGQGSEDGVAREALTQKLSASGVANLLRAGSDSAIRDLQHWQPPKVEELQAMLPQYEVTAFLARGGMGAVYKGVQRSLDRVVAIKILPPDIVDDGEANYTERFKQEARAMARFKHPGIVTVYDAGEVELGRALGPPSAVSDARRLEDQPPHPKLLYFVMEFIEGTDVAQLVAANGKLPVDQALSITIRVCEALAYAHSRGVVHRDIKPSNVMIDSDGQVKVADFGLAKVVQHDSTSLTKSSVAMGTPDFVAPEALIPGMPVDQRADLYAVGVMLYDMLTGKIPRGRFEAVSQVVPKADRRLDAIVDKALQTDREKRYSTALELKEDVESIAPSLGPSSRLNKEAHRGERRGTKRGFLLMVVVLAVLLGIGTFVTLTRNPVDDLAHEPPLSKQGPDERDIGFVKSYAIPGIGHFALVQNDRRVLVAEDKDQMRLLDLETGQAIWRTAIPHASHSRVYGLKDNARALQFAAPKEVIEMRILDLADGTELGLWSTPNRHHQDNTNNCSALSPDQRHFAIGIQPRATVGVDSPTNVWVVDTRTFNLVAEWHLPAVPQLYTLAWLDAERFVISTRQADGLLSFDIRHSNEAPLPHPARLMNFVEANETGQFLAGTQDGNKLALVDLSSTPKSFVLQQPFGARVVRFAGTISLVALEFNGADLIVFDLASRRATQTIRLLNKGNQLAVSLNGQFALTKDDVMEAGVKKATQLSLWRLRPIAPAIATTASATKENPFVNTLGMKFVPVPITGGPTDKQRVLFSVWETRVQDYEAFVKETKREWPKPNFEQGPTHPAVMTSWEDAKAFCAWLTDKERKAGKIGAADEYRLPTDHEWSCAVGIGDREDGNRPPHTKQEKVAGVYPWGADWPPPAGAGNHHDEAARKEGVGQNKPGLDGYNDGWAWTAPVGSFPPNAHGLHDLSGNAGEWCEDWIGESTPLRVVRGGVYDISDRKNLLSSYRMTGQREVCNHSYGFRVVLAGKPVESGVVAPLPSASEARAVKLWDSPDKIPPNPKYKWEGDAVRDVSSIPLDDMSDAERRGLISKPAKDLQRGCRPQ